MSKHDLDGSVEPGGGLPSASHGPVDYGLYVFFALGVLAVAAPQLSFIFGGPYWAALAAIAVFVLWISVMPTTCMSGGLYCSLVAMAILFNTLGIVLFAADPVRGFTVFRSSCEQADEDRP
jgi:hypothetical protein